MIPTYTIRAFEPSLAEYEAIVQVYKHANPHEPASAATWHHWDQHRDPASSFTRYVVEHRDKIGGYGFSVRTDVEANKFRFSINFLPSWESAELINSFYSYLMRKCLEMDATGLVCRTRENEDVKITWLKEHGFQHAMRYPGATLDVSKFEPSAYRDLLAKIKAQGLQITSLAELSQRDSKWQRMAYELEMQINQDVPRPTGFSPPPFEQYVLTEFAGPEFMPELWLIALDGDSYVGMSSLWKSGDGVEILETGLTGVLREYRRQGLAKALKSQAIEIAKGLGTRLIQTWNEENNPMFQLNLQLGFQAQPADVDWEKMMPQADLDVVSITG